ncbi:MAG: family 20 glycosylhydrolase [Clostridiales bacterium]|nr:family 20 glycosylhydrolase [Clostridiales bacterium]
MRLSPKSFGAAIFLLAFLFVLHAPVFGQKTGSEPVVPIIPKPEKLERRPGVFELGPHTIIVVDSKDGAVLAVAEELAARIRGATGFSVELGEAAEKKTKNAIWLRTTGSLSRLGQEGYLLSVTKNQVTIEAPAPAGVFYGVQSFYQLLPAAIESAEPASGIHWRVPCVRVEDKPRFRWRGVHLDVCRHFFPPECVKKYLDVLAKYKINTFHWHLTEDQGWRIEIKKYPKLTEIGAWRRETMDDGQPHGGFYTQEEVREIVDHARKRFITIVPEIEMPGHSQAALAAYPELSCSGGPFKVGTEWGVIYDVYCAGNEKTFEFLEDVLTEVIELFPGEFIHIGGDEVPKLRWQNCVKCQARIKAEGLPGEEALQSYFIHRVEKFLNANGKRLIGWDEILEGGLAPNATVMSWRGVAGGIEAAKSGHDVVMSPYSHCYFDFYQGEHDEPRAIGGFTPIDKVYSYEPVPAELTAAEARHVLGAQANVWTEYMPSFQQVEYMLLPRLLALSEVVWTKKETRNFQDFSQRIIPHYDRLAAMETNFRLPPPAGVGGQKVAFMPVVIKIDPPYPGAIVRYTLDGPDPTPESPLYNQPLEISKSSILKARTFLPGGRASRTINTFISLVNQEENGLEYAYYEGSWFRLPDLGKLMPVKTGRVYDLTLEPAGPKPDNFAVWFKGFINIPTTDEYTFTLIANDGASVSVGDKEVVRNDGLFGIRELSGKIALEAGKYPLSVSYFQKTGSRELLVLCEGPGMERQPLPPHWLFVK